MALALTWNSRANLNLKFSEFFNSNHTISVWFMPQFPDSYIGPIVGESSSPVTPGQVPSHGMSTPLFLMGTGAFGAGALKSTCMALLVGGTPQQYDCELKANTWHHAAVVRSGKTFTLFVNGVAQSPTITLNTTPSSTDIPLRLGHTNKWKSAFDKRPAQFYGLIDDLAIFTKALTASEIANLAKPSTKLTGNEASLLSGFPLSKAAAAASTKLGGKVTLHGQAALVDTGATRSAADAKFLPMPSEAFQFTLPVSLHQPLFVGQGPKAIGGSHKGGRNFPYDLTPAKLSPSGDIDKFANHKPIPNTPFFALSAGRVDLVNDNVPPGKQTPPDSNALFISIDGMPGYWWKHAHWKSGTAKVSKGDKVKPGQLLAHIGDSGVDVGNIHLHTSIVYFPDGETPPDNDDTTHTVSVPYAFADYFVLDRKEDATGTHDTWKHVDIGIPERQAITNSPPLVLTKDKLKMPTNQDHLRKRGFEIQKRLVRPRRFVTLKD